MKKTLILILGCAAFVALSCQKTCTCVDANDKPKQFEVNPSDKCSDLSGTENGTCTNA